jgi:hypothetical protein
MTGEQRFSFVPENILVHGNRTRIYQGAAKTRAG